MKGYSLTVFISAYLLFVVQPMMGKYILPWFGGGSAVWTSVLLFFQLVLLAGYAYSYLLSRFLSISKQYIIHAVLLLSGLIFLPVIPDPSGQPVFLESPIWQITLLLLATVGLPYFLLSATSPLLQSWFTKHYPDKTPWSLYALSNVASLLALLTYPFLIAPAVARTDQVIGWSMLWGVFLILSFYLVIRGLNSSTESYAEEELDEPKPSILKCCAWISISTCTSILLHAVTNQLSINISPIPFLWILPLVAYLISFIISFCEVKIYRRKTFIPLLFIVIIFQLYAIMNGVNFPLIWQIITHAGGFLIIAFVLHSELYILRPDKKYLTTFYLSIALGGAIGGVFVALIVPFYFTTLIELPIGISASAFIILSLSLYNFNWRHEKLRHGLGLLATGTGVLIVITAVYFLQGKLEKDTIFRARNFYGILHIKGLEKDKPDARRMELYNGGVNHGVQFFKRDLQRWPTTYFSIKSGAGLVFLNFKKDQSRKIGVVGLGAGTLMAYGEKKDTFKIYEINQYVADVANNYFSYLSVTPAKSKIVIGDARLSLEKEDSQKFDILAVDAFNGDAIPTHLLTLEAFELYMRHMNDDGIILIHISNLYFDLEPVIHNMAKHLDLHSAIIINKEDLQKAITPSKWALISKNKPFLNSPVIRGSTNRYKEEFDHDEVWTDEKSDLFTVFKYNKYHLGLIERVRKDIDKIFKE